MIFPVIAHHKNPPVLSTQVMARKSFEGEDNILVATLEVQNASIKRPVSTSNVHITESKAVTTNHRESGEKVYDYRCKKHLYIEQ